MKWAIIDTQNIVTNIIVWDGMSPYDPGEGNTLIKINDGVYCAIGWIYDPATQTFSPPAEPTS